MKNKEIVKSMGTPMIMILDIFRIFFEDSFNCHLGSLAYIFEIKLFAIKYDKYILGLCSFNGF
jgi:hypothetical protein